jgi:phosphoribosylformylglycinamidine cyclo-ligase
MPGFYPAGRYDVAGFSIGALERNARFHTQNVLPGDVVLGFASSGFHSNGFSLVRKVLESQKWDLNDKFENQTLGEYLITPTRLYVKPLLKIFKEFDIKGAANITGGGLIDNLPRAVQESKVQIRIHEKSVPVPPTMKRFVDAAGLSREEAFSTWNMGVGFCIYLSRAEADRLLKNAALFSPWPIFEIGEVEARAKDSKTTVLVQ